MPRKHRRDPAFFQPPAPVDASRTTPDAPAWARATGYEVRTVGGQKEYRCPGCDHEVRAGVVHLVVVPVGDVDARRHWHTECWRSELRRQGLYRRPSSTE
jgi:hypothetical protein